MSIIAYPLINSLEENRKCPKCGAKLHSNGKRKRFLIRNDHREELYLKRYRCSKCGHSVLAAAEGMLPYKHYAASEIEAVVDDEGSHKEVLPAVEESTVRRWRREVNSWIQQALGKAVISAAPEIIQQIATLPPLQALRKLISVLSQKNSLLNTTIEYAYWLSHPLRL